MTTQMTCTVLLLEMHMFNNTVRRPLYSQQEALMSATTNSDFTCTYTVSLRKEKTTEALERLEG